MREWVLTAAGTALVVSLLVLAALSGRLPGWRRSTGRHHESAAQRAERRQTTGRHAAIRLPDVEPTPASQPPSPVLGRYAVPVE